MSSLFDRLPKAARDRLKETPQPSWVQPMLATLTDDYFSDRAWLFERKLDGERCLAFRKNEEVRLLSRNRKELNETYPEVVEALGKQQVNSFIIDGEIVAFEGALTSFSRLQQRMQVRDARAALDSGVPVFYYLFDILYLDGDGLPRKGVHWVAPELVAQIGFTEWTRDGKLRHPRFLGLRRDKRPREVVREKA